MKKLLTLLYAIVFAVVMAVPAMVSASYTPTVSFVPEYETGDGNTITLNRSDIAEGLTVPAYIYIDDDSLLAFSIDLKFKTSDSHITIDNIKDPQEELAEYAYAETTEDGEIIKNRISIAYGRTSLYSYFTCGLSITASDRSPLVPYGENSDDYPLTEFDIVISPDTPAGEYEVYFVTEPEGDIAYSHVSKVGLRNGEEIYPPLAENLTIVILDDNGLSLGDVNGDGFIDSNDASLILSDYTAVSTGGTGILTDAQYIVADTDKNGIADSVDASNILSYYSYVATVDNPVGIEDYLSVS